MKNIVSTDCCGNQKSKSPKASTRKVHADELTKMVPEHPDHSNQVARLNRVIGQIEGIKRMIAERRYCPEILIQSRAVASALKAIELGILEKHVRHCVSEVLVTKDMKQTELKIRELISVLDRF